MTAYIGAERVGRKTETGARTWVWSPVAYCDAGIMPWNPVFQTKAAAKAAAAEWLIAQGQDPATALPHVTTKPPRKY